MFQLSWPYLLANPQGNVQLIVPANSNKFINKLDQFFLTENNIHPCKPEKQKCTINKDSQFDLTGAEVYIVTFPAAPRTLAESVLNYMMTN